MASKPPLRAVKDGETPPAPRKRRAPAKARTMAHAAKLSRKTMLETVRDKIAASMDDPRAHPRDVMAGAKQLLEIQNQIDQLNPKKVAAAAPKTAVANTPNDDWDQDAI